MCLVGVCKVSNRCLEGIKIVPGVWKESGRYQEGLRKGSEMCLDSAWKVSGISLVGCWRVLGRCLELEPSPLTYLISTRRKGPM